MTDARAAWGNGRRKGTPQAAQRARARELRATWTKPTDPARDDDGGARRHESCAEQARQATARELHTTGASMPLAQAKQATN